MILGIHLSAHLFDFYLHFRLVARDLAFNLIIKPLLQNSRNLIDLRVPVLCTNENEYNAYNPFLQKIVISHRLETSFGKIWRCVQDVPPNSKSSSLLLVA